MWYGWLCLVEAALYEKGTTAAGLWLCSDGQNTPLLATQVRTLACSFAQRENGCCYAVAPSLVVSCELPRAPWQPWTQGLPASREQTVQGHRRKCSFMNSTWQATWTTKFHSPPSPPAEEFPSLSWERKPSCAYQG